MTLGAMLLLAGACVFGDATPKSAAKPQSGKQTSEKKLKAGIIPYIIDPKTNDVKILIGFGPAKYYWSSKTEFLPCSLVSKAYVRDKWTDFGGSVEDKDLKKYSQDEAMKVAAAREAHEELMGYFSAPSPTDISQIADTARTDDAIKQGIEFWEQRIHDENKVTTQSGYIYWLVPLDYPVEGVSAQLEDLRRLYIASWDRSPIGSQRTIPCGGGNYQWPFPDSFTEKRDFRWISAQELLKQLDKLDEKNPTIQDPVKPSNQLELYPRFVQSLKEGKGVLARIVSENKKKPASPDYDDSITQLMKAVAQDDFKEITLLMRRGENPFFKDKNGKSALDYITYFNKPIKKGTFKIISISTPDRKSFAQITGKNQKDYAEKYHYSYRVYDHSFDTNRPEEWSKIVALMQQIGKTSHEWLMWIDDDIMITNPSIKLESFVAKYPHYDLIIAKDALVPMNNGIFLIRNNNWAKKFLMDVWITGAYRNLLTRGESLLEQQTMTDLYDQKKEYKDKIVIIPQRELNSFLRSAKDYPDDPQESKWQPGDFVAHITGTSYENRTKIAQDLEKDIDDQNKKKEDAKKEEPKPETKPTPKPPLVEPKPTQEKTGPQVSPSGLISEVLVPAPAGAQQPKLGDTVTIQFTSWIQENGIKGRKISALPAHRMIVGKNRYPGLNEALLSMQVGQKSLFILPPNLAEGEKGNKSIPPHSTLIFEIQLLSIEPRVKDL